MIASWNVTNRCNLLCEHCYRDAGDSAVNELSTEEGIALLDEIAKAGFRLMVFSGGEPFMREDIFTLTKHAASLGMRPVYGTNGTLLTKDFIKKIMEAGGASVAISLHMLDEKAMDEFCDTPGAFKNAIQAMENCRELGFPFQVNTTVFERNVNDIEKICDFAKEMGAMSHHVLFMVPTGRAVDIEEESLRAKEYERLIRLLLRKRKELDFDIKPTCAPQFMRIAKQAKIDVGRYTRGCLAGITYCSITPTGDVFPCPYLPLKVGNIRETPFSQIWKEDAVMNKLRTLDYSGNCGICDFKDTCGGCRARAFFYDGDYMAGEAWCSYKGGISPE